MQHETSHVQDTKWKKTDSKDNIIYGSTYTILWKSKTLGNEIRSVNARGLGWELRKHWQVEIFSILIVLAVNGRIFLPNSYDSVT